MAWSWYRRLPRSCPPSPVRQDSAPECEAGASPHIPGGCAVVLPRRTRPPTTSLGGIMATPMPTTSFADPAPAPRLERAAAALTAHGFTVEILDDAAAARTRIKDLIPEGASVFTGASETLRRSGIDEDINTSGRYQAIRPRVLAMDRVTGADDIRRLLASPDVAVGSVAALTETGSLV